MQLYYAYGLNNDMVRTYVFRTHVFRTHKQKAFLKLYAYLFVNQKGHSGKLEE
jgi:hypothetical protein